MEQLKDGISVPDLTEHSGISGKRNLMHVVYADYMMMVLSDVQRVAIGVVASLLLIISVVGNVTTIWVNIRRKIRPCFRACLLSLALSDLLTAVLQSASYLAQMSVDYVPIWVLGRFMCSAIPFVTTMAILANSFTLAAIAFDRYVAVVKIVKSGREPSGVLCVVLATAVWALAGGISSPMWNTYFIIDITLIHTSPLNRSQEVGVSSVQSCTSVKAPNLYYYSIVFLVIFLPLVLVFVWLNAKIAKEIWRRRRPLMDSASPISASLETSTCNRSKRTDNRSPSSLVAIDNRAFEEEEISEDKRTSETNTVSNEFNGRPVGSDPLKLSPSPKSQTATSQAMRTRSTREIRQLRMFRVILVLISAFLVCRLPTWIYLLYKLENVANTNLHWMLQYVFGLLSVFNCVVNPLLYTFLMETIQCSFTIFDRMKKLTRCPGLCCGRRVQVEEHMCMHDSSEKGVVVWPRFYCSEDRKLKLPRLN